MRALRRTSTVAVAVGTSVLLSGCAGLGSTVEQGRSGAGLTVLASFYPLQYVAEKVGGDRVEVTPLTPPGAEPHDLELSPRQVREVGDADVVLYLAGFQPAVDDAVAARDPKHLLDAARTPAVAEHLGEPTGTDDGHGDADPHFWLDPTLLAAVAQDVAVVLGEADPAHADTYAENAQTLADDLDELDAEISNGLATCERRVLVTAHEAFGFLAERYDLEQVGISGLEPESEPSPARLREIREVVTEHGVTTVFTEALLNPKVSQTVAGDLGVRTAVLDPVESQVDPATDYRGAMDLNLAALREALGCT